MCRFDRKIVLVFIQLQVLFFEGKWAKFLPSSSELRESAGCLENICLTPGCVKAAAQILNNMNDTVNPCDDFYQFACGGWQDRHVLQNAMSHVSVMYKSRDDIDTKLRVLLEKPLTDDDPYFVKLLKTMFNSCLDVKKIESLKDKPLKASLEKIGGWPVTLGDKWDDSKSDWIDTLIKSYAMGFSINSLFTISVGNDMKDNTKYTLKLYGPSLDEIYILDYMVEVAINFGAEKDVAKQELSKVFELETKLVEIKPEKSRNFTKMYNMFTIKQLQELSPKIDWLKVINGISGKQITKDELIMVTDPDFAKKLSNIIGNTDKRTIANYLVWCVIRDSMSLLLGEPQDLSQEYEESSGITQQTPRWKICLSSVKSDLTVALGAYYVRNYFKEENKEAAEKMVRYILKESIKILETADWLKSGTRAKAIEKAKNMGILIGYPIELRNDTAVNEYYAGLQLDEGSYYENTRKLQKFKTDESFKHLGKVDTKGKWDLFGEQVMEVNAYYYASKNTIVLPAAILKDEYFSKDRPKYLSYGGIGYTIGHEITHGFDDQGKKFDKNGNLNNWWDPETNERFNKKVQCIIDQYNNYTVEDVGVNVNGSKTQGENIADNGGIREAYKAYQTWVAENGAEKSLPGLKYTPSQLFWMNTANLLCAKFGSEVLKKQVSLDTHSPEKYRVIGSFSNNEEFAKDFNCPSGSKMNPVNKCRVW